MGRRSRQREREEGAAEATADNGGGGGAETRDAEAQAPRRRPVGAITPAAAPDDGESAPPGREPATPDGESATRDGESATPGRESATPDGESATPAREPTAPDGPADDPEPATPDGLPPDPMYADALVDDVARLNVLYHFYRDSVLRARAPEPEDWYASKERPRVAEVEALFGSWEEMVDAASFERSELHALRRDERQRESEFAEREAEQRRHQQGLERDAQRMPELRRQLERAKQAREEAESQLAGARGEAERARAEAARLRERGEQAERAAHDQLTAAAEAAAPASELPAEWLAEHERLAGEVDALRREHDELQSALEQARREVEEERDKVRALARALAEPEAEPDPEADGGAAADAEAPRTVRAAVETAAAEAQGLTFAPRAFDSAQDCPFRRPADILEALRKLDQLAVAYRQPGGLGRSLAAAAADLGLTWRGDVSELARSRFPDEYSFTLDRRRLQLGPHLNIGSGSGAQFVARVYFAMHDGDDDLERGIYVGHVGRHLPDSTT